MKKTSYDKAIKHVNRIKGFYNHLFIYIIFLVFWIIFAGKFFGLLGDRYINPDKGFLDWVNINMWLNPLIWGIILLIHGLYVFCFKFQFFKDWEDRKIQEYMDEEVSETRNR